MSTWYLVANGEAVKPEALDTVNSAKYNYVRKEFRLVAATEEYPEHWEWLETKIRKEDWELFTRLMDHDEALDDVYAALTELAEMIIPE